MYFRVMDVESTGADRVRFDMLLNERVPHDVWFLKFFNWNPNKYD